MPQITAYLAFDGNCGEAMRFYEKALNGKITTSMTNSQAPGFAEMGFPPGNEDRLMHVRLEFDGGVLMAGDSIVGWGETYQGIKGVSVVLVYDKEADGKRVFEALGEGGNVTMAWSPSFWAEGFGMLKDRFGTPWIVNGGMKAF